MKERIILLIDALGMTQRSFSLRIGKSEAFVRSIKNSIGSDVIGSILREFPQVNPVWLINGEGEMFIIGKNDYTSTTKATLVESPGDGYGNPYLDKYIQQLEEENKRLVSYIDDIKNTLRGNQEIIRGFMNGTINKI